MHQGVIRKVDYMLGENGECKAVVRPAYAQLTWALTIAQCDPGDDHLNAKTPGRDLPLNRA